jgi:DNA invertase Pin-like site-specific DNA recombinase
MPRSSKPTHNHGPAHDGPAAYSYIRFSSKPQEAGDSIRRQTEAAKNWAERNNVPLDTSLRIDKGVSAFKGKNADIGALGEFLKLVEQGTVHPGDFLVVEALDRLTRDDVDEALFLLLGMTKAGVKIVQLTPVEVIYFKPVEPLKLMMMVMELMRGNSESKVKSERIGQAWDAKRVARRKGEGQPAKNQNRVNGMQILTHQLPAWVKEEDGIAVEIPERAAVVKKIFHLAREGRGVALIAKKLTEDNVPAFGEVVVREGNKRSAFCGKWSDTSIHRILRDRRVVGEYAPGKKAGKIAGDPIPDYYPRIISDEEFEDVQDAMADRKNHPGRVSMKCVNPFSGLLRSAPDGGTCFVKSKVDRATPTKVLANTEGMEGRATNWTFPWPVFEQALVALLHEVDPEDVLPAGNGTKSEILALSTEESKLLRSIEMINQDMDLNGESAALMKRVRDKETLLREVREKLQAARRKAAHPTAEAWGQARGLLKALDTQEDRLKLRGVLRKLIASVWVLVAANRRDRHALVHVTFKGGASRIYGIDFRPPRGNGKYSKPGIWIASSVTQEDMPGKRLLDMASYAKDDSQAARIDFVMQKGIALAQAAFTAVEEARKTATRQGEEVPLVVKVGRHVCVGIVDGIGKAVEE